MFGWHEGTPQKKKAYQANPCLFWSSWLSPVISRCKPEATF